MRRRALGSKKAGEERERGMEDSWVRGEGWEGWIDLAGTAIKRRWREGAAKKDQTVCQRTEGRQMRSVDGQGGLGVARRRREKRAQMQAGRVVVFIV